MVKIDTISKVIRSKNAGPYELTLDIIIEDPSNYDIIKTKNLINEDIIAALYKIKPEDVKRIIYFDPAHAIKILLVREIVSGAPGDTDVYGAQQHGPLLNLELDI